MTEETKKALQSAIAIAERYSENPVSCRQLSVDPFSGYQSELWVLDAKATARRIADEVRKLLGGVK